MGIESMLTQESMPINKEQPQPSNYGGIGSRIIDISIPETMKTEVKEESFCFNCHRTQHTFFEREVWVGRFEVYLHDDILST